MIRKTKKPEWLRKEQLLWKESEFQKQFNGLDWMKLRAGDPEEWEKARRMEEEQETDENEWED